MLKDALVRASEASGRRLRRIEQDFPTHRAIPLERLDRAGPVRQLAAWQQPERDVAEPVARLRGV